MTSLSIENDKKPEVKIKEDGTKKQCITHSNDKLIATLSVFCCVLIIGTT